MEFAGTRPGLWGHPAALLAALLVLAGGAKATVKPDSTAARLFGAQLQMEFSTRKSAVFLERIDGDAFNERLLGTRDIDAYPWAHCPKDQPPALTKTIVSLDSFDHLAQFRVVLENNVRTLDCEFLTNTGNFVTTRFFLVQDDAGSIRIADYQWGGDAMPKSQIARHSCILEGLLQSGLRDEEEEQLAALSRRYALHYRTMVRLFLNGDTEASFRQLMSFPAELARTRICRHYLTCHTGPSKAVSEELRKILRGDGDHFDPIFRFKVAMGDGDRTAALVAVDDVLDAYHDPALYRTVKAGLLLEEGRPAEAYAIARETISLNPRTGLAYLAAVRAAVGLNRAADALAVMTEWSRIAQPSDISRLLSAVPLLTEFCASREYLEWKQQMTPATSAPPADSP